jgi:hypothetical protein
MAVKKEELQILKEILAIIHSRHPHNYADIFTNYSIDTIINGSDEEKIAYVKKYLEEIKVPELETNEAGVKASVITAEAETTAAKAILTALNKG